jgi:predicted acyltransferase
MSQEVQARDRQRLLSLDAFRGLTILAMILVNNPGSWAPGMRYAPLDHAEWHGWTPTDLIFPFFLFIVGTSLAYSLRKYSELGGATPELYARIIRRTCILFLLGVGMAFFGHACDRCFGDATDLGFDHLRYLGVLQRIALVYFFASIIVLNMSVRAQVLLSIAILLGYWALLAWFPSSIDYQGNLSPKKNLIRAVDLKVVGADHLYTRATTEPTEPEGLVSTPPSIVITLLGYWTGLVVRRRGPNFRTVAWLIAGGLVLAALGLAWDRLFPINKKIWTSSYVLLAGGLAMAALAICLAVFDVLQMKRLSRPFEIVGVNAIFVYVASGLLARLLEATHVGQFTTKAWIFQRVFADHIADPKLASLGFAFATVAFWWIILWAMSRRGWSIRV